MSLVARSRVFQFVLVFRGRTTDDLMTTVSVHTHILIFILTDGLAFSVRIRNFPSVSIPVWALVSYDLQHSISCSSCVFFIPIRMHNKQSYASLLDISNASQNLM